MTEPSAPLFAVGSGGLREAGEYDPGITEEVDRQIRNMDIVVNGCYDRAVQLLKEVGSDNFEIVLSTEHGAQVSNQQRDAFGRTKFMGRKLKYNENTKTWGSGLGPSEHGTARSRPRAYVAPANADGIREELKDAVLLKAALGMSGR